MDDKSKQLDLEKLEAVSGGQWTPGDWIDENWVFVSLEFLPNEECGVCGEKGCVYNGYFEPNSQHLRMRCSKCGGSVGMPV